MFKPESTPNKNTQPSTKRKLRLAAVAALTLVSACGGQNPIEARDNISVEDPVKDGSELTELLAQSAQELGVEALETVTPSDSENFIDQIRQTTELEDPKLSYINASQSLSSGMPTFEYRHEDRMLNAEIFASIEPDEHGDIKLSKTMPDSSEDESIETLASYTDIFKPLIAEAVSRGMLRGVYFTNDDLFKNDKYNSDDRSIYISTKGLTPEMLENVLLHELIHAPFIDLEHHNPEVNAEEVRSIYNTCGVLRSKALKDFGEESENFSDQIVSLVDSDSIDSEKVQEAVTKFIKNPLSIPETTYIDDIASETTTSEFTAKPCQSDFLEPILTEILTNSTSLSENEVKEKIKENTAIHGEMQESYNQMIKKYSFFSILNQGFYIGEPDVAILDQRFNPKSAGHTESSANELLTGVLSTAIIYGDQLADQYESLSESDQQLLLEVIRMSTDAAFERSDVLGGIASSAEAYILDNLHRRGYTLAA